jgi:hypothetical protein
MKKIRTWLTYDHSEFPGSLNKQPSCTIPDQTMSLQVLISRYARGLPISGKLPEPDNGLAPDDILNVNLKTLDLTERAALLDKVETELKGISQRKKERDAKKAKDTMRQAIEAEMATEAAKKAFENQDDTKK